MNEEQNTPEEEHEELTSLNNELQEAIDRGDIERFNRTIQEEAELGQFLTPVGLEEVIESYLEYYNYDRLHLSIGLITPNEKVKTLAKVLT